MSLFSNLISKVDALIGGSAQGSRNDLVIISPDDPAMKEAFDAARASLDVFSRAHDQNDGRNTNFAVKLACGTRGGGVEYIWIGMLGPAKGAFQGVVLNTPAELPYRKDQKIIFDIEEVHDWSYVRDGKAYGQFTTRVLCDRVPADEAQEMLKTLWPTPLPPETH